MSIFSSKTDIVSWSSSGLGVVLNLTIRADIILRRVFHMPRSHIHGFDAGLATATILHHPWQSVFVRIDPYCIRNHT